MTSTPIRRIIRGPKTVSQSNALRRSLADQRSLEKQANQFAERDAHEYSADITDETAELSRRDNADVELDDSQNSAIDMMLHNLYGVVAGYAGTGKTTTMKKALSKLQSTVRMIDYQHFRSVGKEHGNERRPAIALCCFTNVAARNLASKLDPYWAPHCMSIHSLLAFAPVEQDDFDPETGRASMRFEPRYHSSNKLPIDILIIDEAGIVSNELWGQIIDACRTDTRIYFLGDMAQLPAMQGVSPMPFAIAEWPVVELTKIYRQAADNPIIGNLTRIRQGLPPVHDANNFRCGTVEELPHSAIAAQKHVSSYISKLYKMGVWDPRLDMIITPQNETMLGQIHWNTAFRLHFNPPKYDPDTKLLLNPPVLIGTARGGNMLAIGDKVMATDNGGRGATEHRFVNGSIGTVVAIKPNPRYTGDMAAVGEMMRDETEDAFDWDDVHGELMAFNEEHADEIAESVGMSNDDERKSRAASHIVTVVETATGEIFELSRSAEVASLSHAYAVTCHRFQGSQARNVIVIAHTSMNFGLNREWLYTACSRAQNKVFLLSEPGALDTAIRRQQLYGRSPKEKAERLRSIYESRTWARPSIPRNHPINSNVEI